MDNIITHMEFEMRVRERAYYLWVEANRPHGKDQEFWLQAEKDVLEMMVIEHCILEGEKKKK